MQQRANHRAVIAEFTAADIHDLYQMRKLLEGEAQRAMVDHLQEWQAYFVNRFPKKSRN